MMGLVGGDEAGRRQGPGAPDVIESGPDRPPRGHGRWPGWRALAVLLARTGQLHSLGVTLPPLTELAVRPSPSRR